MVNQTIGILAGMGPKSTGPFIDQVVTQYQVITGAIHDIDFPPIMIYSLPTPFYLDRPIDHNLMEKTICTGLKRLATCQIAFIAMPCITAHLYFERLKQCIQIPLLNIIDLTLKAIPRVSKKMAILATRPTFESLLFQKGLKDIECEYIVQVGWQDKIDELIAKIKRGDSQLILLPLWNNLVNELQLANVDTLIIACTDLNVLFTNIKPPFQIIDASLCLANATVNKWIEMASSFSNRKF